MYTQETPYHVYTPEPTSEEECEIESPAKKLKPQFYPPSHLYSEGIATTPLYEGSSTTVLQTLVQLFTWFSEHPGISKEALLSLLYLQHHTILPPGNLLPDSYQAALTEIEPFLVQTQVYHACPRDCILFRGNYACLSNCPECSSHLYVPDTSKPVRKFSYLPLGPRLARLFGDVNLAHLVQCHSGSELSDELCDIHGSPIWSEVYSPQGLFGGDKRGISLALCTDGVNPFRHNKV